jgi:phage terminase large subunit-like protein
MPRNLNWTCKIIEKYCLQTEGEDAGKPVKLMPWQKRFISDMEGKRDVWLEIPRKNGKTATIAMIAIAHMLKGWRDDTNPEVILAASTKEQAGILFRYCTNMIIRSPALQVALRPMQYEIRLKGKPGFLKTVAADGGSNHGHNPSLILCDEIHAWSETKGPELWEALETSRGYRNAQMISITTAGAAYSWAWMRHEYARRVIDGEIADANMSATIYAADDTDDWELIKTWRKANPSMKYLKGIETNLRAELIKGRHDDLKKTSFRKLYLNQWLGTQEGYIDHTDWVACKGQRPKDLETWTCLLGCDFAAVNDFVAYALLWYKGTRFYTEQHYQISERSIKRRENQYPALVTEWRRKGMLEVIDGDVITSEDYINKIESLIEQYGVQKMFFDPWNAHETSKRITQTYGDNFAIAVRQNFAMINEPMKMLYKLVSNREIMHDGNPVTTWMMGNVVLVSDKNENWSYDKKRSPEKIDGVAALVTGLSGYVNDGELSYFETNDLISI